MTASIPTRLLDWYDAHARDLPWRAPPGMPPMDPYRVWLSEVMLQQTTVAAVKPYFAEFTRRWPTIEDLAAAREEDIVAAWAGLGYYSRARNLVKCAGEIAALGQFPQSEADLRRLPGLGAYTAAAIAAIAFDRRAVVVDANVERVAARLFAIEAPLPAARKEIREKVDGITPDTRPGDFAQAMMDLGATVCTNRDPKCLLCPLARDCAGRRSGDPARFPRRPAEREKPVRRGRTYWIERGNSVWLVRRERKGMLGGMRALPDDGWSAGGDGTGEAPMGGEWQSVGLVRHGFSHFGLELSVMRHSGDGLPDGEGEWWSVDRLGEAGLPTLFSKAARLASAD